MSANYHSPLAPTAPANSLGINVPLGQLDQAITDLDTRMDAVEAIFAGTSEFDMLNLGAGTELTIASGAVTIAGSRHTVDTEGDAASDYLDTINAADGDFFILQLENATRAITIRHLQDNVICIPAIDYTWDSISVKLTCFYDGTYVYVRTPSTQAEAIALVQDEKAQNTDGGASVAAWTARDINAKEYDPSVICSITKLAFTSGGTAEIEVGDEIEGATGGATATVFDVELTGGSWAGGDAAGNLWLNDQVGAFVAENLDTDAQANIATVAADSTDSEIRLKAGTYRAVGRAPAYSCARHQTRLQDTTNAATLITGSSMYALAGGVETDSWVNGRFTLAAVATLEFQHYCQNVIAGNGYGEGANFTTEIYSQLTIIKEL